MMARAEAYIGLGSNLGDRAGNLAAARRELAKLGTVAAESSVYETDPWGVLGPQPDFLNQVVCLSTVLQPREIMRALLAIESRMGRVRTGTGEPRAIDLDLLICGESVIDNPGLTLPHPRMHLRAFVLTPFAEIAPGVMVPGLGRTISEMAAEVGSRGVRRWTGGTGRAGGSGP